MDFMPIKSVNLRKQSITMLEL